MLLGREHISETDSHASLRVQFRLSEIGATARVDSPDDLTVRDVDLTFVAADKAEANDRQPDGGGQLKAIVDLDPAGKKSCQPDVFAHERDHPFATKRAPDDPRFQGTKSPAELNAIVHVIFFSLDRISPQIFRHKGENAPQSLQVAHVEDAEV